ncbi:MAG: alkaline phosphatase family protein [Clostridia bacterium]|nr:alkaline phosphatase family protein [Clostridia bacterium]
MHNPNSLTSLAAALAYAMGVEAPACAEAANPDLVSFVDEFFGGQKIDRLVMYNPDAIAEWVYRKYPKFVEKASEIADIELPMATVMPSVTPVCFGTMYTGAYPTVHGIQKYEKPIIRIDTLFDVWVRAGKKVALITYGSCSLGKIFLERPIDYYHFDEGGIEAVNAKTIELLLKNEHDVYVIYNGNFDSIMHKNGPESPISLAELRLNASIYRTIANIIGEHWTGYNTLLGFAMDHGCHEIDGENGSHGLDMDEDINIVHLYKGFKKQ